MPAFVQQFRFEGNLFVFRFYKIQAPEGVRYSVAFDLDNTVQRFEMKRKESGEWKITASHSLPSWITDAEEQFSNAIRQQE